VATAPATALPADSSGPGAQDRTVAEAWPSLVERLVRGLDRGGREWTVGRRKESVNRVLVGARGDAAKLQQRLLGLLGAWESDRADAVVELVDESPGVPPVAAAPVPDSAPGTRPAPLAPPDDAPAPTALTTMAWPPLAATLGNTVQAALPPDDPRAAELASRLAGLAERIAQEGASPALVAQVEAACADASRLFAHRHHLVEELARLCRELTAGLVDLSEDDSWSRGQCENLHARLAEELSARSVRAAGDLLAEARQRQQQLRGERDAARDALKALIQRLLLEVGELDQQTGRFEHTVGRHSDAIARAGTLADVAAVVRDLLDESRAVQALVHGTRERLAAEHAKAIGLESKVRALESELRRVSDEATTDALTQIANRRGLQQAFVAEAARAGRDTTGASLSVALLDIDNFKRLNDTLGHAAGDQALQALAGAVRERLRPVDHLARFGGEEFVVLMPATPAADAQQAMTRLQRSLSGALFMHEGRNVLVTFSAGVTAWQPGESLETALERADEALYEAKRNGKNRCCLA